MWYTMSPSSRLSSTPVTVTVCGVFQLADVKVSEAGATVPSVVSSELSPIVTGAVGWLVSLTANVAVAPASDVTSPLVGNTTIPAESSSVVATDTSATGRPSNAGSALVVALVTIVYAT